MYPKFWKFWKILGIFRICDGESPAKIRRNANFFSRNRRICAGDPTSQTRRTCEKFAVRNLRKCAWNAPNSVLKFAFATRFRLRRRNAVALANFCEFFAMRRIFAGESPAQISVFSKNISHLRRRSDVENAAHLRKIRGAKSSQMRPKCAKFRLKIRICDTFSPYLRRSHLRIFRYATDFRRRIAGANRCIFEKYFAFAPAIRRRKRCALAKNSRCEIFANAPEMRQIPS